MEEAIKKADVLVEALPYIQKFHGKIIVIKYGGSALENPKIRNKVLKDIIFLNAVGTNPVLVHGGGPSINARMRQRGLKVEFEEGLRVTNAPTMKVVDEVLSELNQQLAQEINSLGARSAGLLSKKDKIILAKERKLGHKSLGYTGQIEKINTAPIMSALKKGAIPVISPAGIGKDRKPYNVNADEAASAIASALGAEKLVLLTNVRGIMRDKADETSIISTLKLEGAKDLLKRGIIDSGMIPKVDAGISALRGGVKKVHIIDARLSHSVLLEIFTDKGVGTEIIKNP